MFLVFALFAFHLAQFHHANLEIKVVNLSEEEKMNNPTVESNRTNIIIKCINKADTL